MIWRLRRIFHALVGGRRVDVQMEKRSAEGVEEAAH